MLAILKLFQFCYLNFNCLISMEENIDQENKDEESLLSNIFERIIKFILLLKKNVNNYLQKSTLHLCNFDELDDLSYLQLFCV